MNQLLRRACILTLVGTLLLPVTGLSQFRRRSSRTLPGRETGTGPRAGSAAPGPAGGAIGGNHTGTGAFSRIRVAYKLDPRITEGLDIGERWAMSAAYAAAQSGETLSLGARALGIDAQGTQMKVGAQWIPADPGMVTVWPAEDGNEVVITVVRAGESSLRVIAGTLSLDLNIKAARRGGIIRVELSEKQ